jgi:hypothetical protein
MSSYDISYNGNLLKFDGNTVNILPNTFPKSCKIINGKLNRVDSIDQEYYIDSLGKLRYTFTYDQNTHKFLSICKILNYKSSKDTLRDHVFKENKIKLKDLQLIIKNKDHPDTIYINENGLYTLLIKSRMKNALDFQLWIVNDVLPKIKKIW